jgi:hypothetical protein
MRSASFGQSLKNDQLGSPTEILRLCTSDTVNIVLLSCRVADPLCINQCFNLMREPFATVTLLSLGCSGLNNVGQARERIDAQE